MADGEQGKWTPQVVGQHVSAVLCVANLFFLWQEPGGQMSYDFWFVPPYVILSTVWAVAGLMTARSYGPMVIYALCVAAGISLSGDMALDWSGPNTRSRKLIEILNSPEPEHTGRT